MVRFKSVWILRETFHEEIEKSWRKDVRMDANLREDRKDINSWKINTFEKVLNRKKELMARLAADGDRNTRYYHMKIVSRRRKNKILMLNNDYGISMKDESELKRHANDYYMKLFTFKRGWREWKTTKVTFLDLHNDDIRGLAAKVEYIEVKKFMFMMKQWKAPGETSIVSMLHSVSILN
ncbi:hypothetical protein KIW84_011697 [Lathyrus oleraceus]|uniref:Uncharacterized protein n=1 Tax=Pisum sativum TaxID=3888 RepID=A0A9D5GVD9_PEA|nr:hypothetical protein KIW84_011697 [Pisum sativum]